MKILHVIASMDPVSGGPCQGIRNSIPELEKLKIHREVVSLDNPKSAFLGKDNFPIHALGPTKTAWCYSPRLIPWLTENICRFDKVIINGLWLYHGYAVRKVLRRLQKQGNKCPDFFVMAHGMLDPYFQRAAHRKLKAIRNIIYWALIERKIVNEAKAALFTCQMELELARVPFRPYHPKKEVNVGYGVAPPPLFTEDMKHAFLRSCPQIANEPYLLFLSRIHNKKGVDILINAYSRMLNHPISRNKIPKLVIAGPGMETTYGRKIKKMVEKSDDLKANIFFTGMLTGNVKWGALYGCEAFVLPSHQENFGIAIVEAMACGKAVLISNQINICKEIEAANAGYVAEDTLDGTRELLDRWLVTEENKKEMGKSAANCYENNFTIKGAARKFLDAITN